MPSPTPPQDDQTHPWLHGHGGVHSVQTQSVFAELPEEGRLARRVAGEIPQRALEA